MVPKLIEEAQKEVVHFAATPVFDYMRISTMCILTIRGEIGNSISNENATNVRIVETP
jgi:hypothetical protein